MLHKIRRFCEGVLGRKLTLENVHQRCKIHVHGAVASPNSVASPLSPVRAAVLTHCLVRQLIRRDRNGEVYTFYEPFNLETELGELIIETAHGTVMVPPDRLEVEYATAMDRNPQEIMGKPPTALLEAIQAETRSDGGVLYNERYLSNGEKVALRCVVEPLRTGGGAYRGGAAPADFVAVSDVEVPRLRELWDGGLS